MIYVAVNKIMRYHENIMMELIQELGKDGSDTKLTHEQWFSYSMEEKVNLLKAWMKELMALDANLANEHGHSILKRRKELKESIKNATIFESAYFDPENHEKNI